MESPLLYPILNCSTKLIEEIDLFLLLNDDIYHHNELIKFKNNLIDIKENLLIKNNIIFLNPIKELNIKLRNFNELCNIYAILHNSLLILNDL